MALHPRPQKRVRNKKEPINIWTNFFTDDMITTVLNNTKKKIMAFIKQLHEKVCSNDKWLLAFCASRFYFANWIFSWFMPFSMRCNNAHFARFCSIIIWRHCSTLLFSTPSICMIEFCRCFGKPPLVKRACILACTSAFKAPTLTAYILFSNVYYINSLAV